MKPTNLLIAAPLLLALTSTMQAATFAEVATAGDSIGTNYVFNGNAGIGGNDYDTTGIPETGIFTRAWTTAAPGSTGIDVSVTGLAFGLPGGSNTDGNVITATITYLGADGVGGGGDDVVLGSTKASLVFNTTFDGSLAGRYEWLFDSAIVGNIDGANKVFAVKLESLEADNGASTFNMRFKTTSGSAAGAVKIDVAGTSTTSGTITDLDNDGLNDAFETNTGIYVNPINTGTDPNDPDTDEDDLLDGEENNSGTFVSATETGTSPVDSDSDNDGLNDGLEANPAVIGYTATNPTRRDTDNDGLGDKFEIDNGLDVLSSADFDSDTFSDFDEVMLYGSDPKVGTSFPGDGTAPAVGSFTEVLYFGTVLGGENLPLPPMLGDPAILNTAIVNEAVQGGNDLTYASGVTDFTVVYPNIFPSAGTSVTIGGLAWVVISVANLPGDLRIEFYDPSAADSDADFKGVDLESLVGTVKATFNHVDPTGVDYFAFDTPVTFTSAGTGLGVRILSTDSLRFKAQNDIATGFRYSNQGAGQFAANNSVRLTLFGTVVASAIPEILNITRSGTTTSLTWDLGAAASVDLERSTDLGVSDPWSVVLENTSNTTYQETSSDPKAFFRIVSP